MILATRCIAAAAALFLYSCATSPRFTGRESNGSSPASPPTRTEPTRASVAPNPTGKALLTLEGIASYYADDFHGKLTSNGEVYDMNGMTAAHRTFPFGTRIRVTNLDNGKVTVVRVNDRGPFVEGRIVDLSLGAAKVLGLVASGTARVRLEVLEWGKGQ